MKKRKKKNGITLLALVITIVIMLLLAGVAIQMTMGENGLIAKSVQAQKEQAKAELYDTAKLSYMSLNAKAIENGQPSPQAELSLSTTEFTNKYNVVGDDITDKKGTVIDTKANVLNIIQGTVAGGFTPGTSTGTTTPAESWPKTVGGVTIPEEDKDKMILKLKILEDDVEISFGGLGNTSYEQENQVCKVDCGNGINAVITNFYGGTGYTYQRGEYIIKVEKTMCFSIGQSWEYPSRNQFEVEILQWGKMLPNDNVVPSDYDFRIDNVTKIYEPEPENIAVWYKEFKMASIPAELLKNKRNAKKLSYFKKTNITSIPEDLYSEYLNVTDFSRVFYGCTGLTSIPEGLFKNNVNAKKFEFAFAGCTGLTSIPDGLFKNNINVTSFYCAFQSCIGLTSIPEGLFKNNVNVINFGGTFTVCKGLTSIPEKIIELVKKIEEKGGNVSSMFSFCTSASNYNSLPNYMQ